MAVVDRVNTTFATWMGTTMACAQCHTHKYDPITHHEYFQVFDAFNQTEDADRRDESPVLELKDQSVLQLRDSLGKQMEAQEERIAELEKNAVNHLVETKRREGELKTRYVRVTNLVKQGFLHLAEVEIFAKGENLARSGKASQISTGFDGPAHLAIDGNADGNYQSKSVTHTAKADDPWLEIDLGSAKKIDRIVVHNRTDGGTAGRIKEFQIVALNENKEPNWVRRIKQTPNPSYEVSLPLRFENFSKEEKEAVARDAAPNELTLARKKLEELKKRFSGIKGPTVPIFRERTKDKRRNTFVHLRGSYLSHGDQVHAGFPSSLFDAPQAADSPNRLDFARWIMTRNRQPVWEKIFGIGLVATSEEFGSQGLPSHPHLLDWLATEMIAGKWNVKAFIKLLVTPKPTDKIPVNDEMAADDPLNRLLEALTRGFACPRRWSVIRPLRFRAC